MKKKFRGESYRGGRFVYGYYVQFPSGDESIIPEDVPMGDWEPIKAGSARQLVGYDADGAEIYEGDEILIGTATYEAKRLVGEEWLEYGLVRRGRRGKKI